MATIQNDTVYKNADWEWAARWEVGSTVYVLSDAAMMVKRPDTGELLVEASVGDGITLDGVDGWATVVVLKAAWADVDYTGVAEYDLVVTRSSDGRTKNIVAGELVIKQGVTD